MEVKLEIKKRNLDFGILTWPYSMDFEIKSLFELKNNIDIQINGKILKNRKISYKYRRISVGKKRIEVFVSNNYFILKKKSNTIHITAI